MKTEQIAVYPIGAFDTDKCKGFRILPLQGVQEKYSFLKHIHRQSFYMILCVRTAEGCLVADQQNIVLDRPAVICIKPNSVISLDIHKDGAGQVICFTEDFFSLRYNNNELQPFLFMQSAAAYVYPSAENLHKWEQIIQLMQTEFESNLPGNETVIRSYLNIFLYELEKVRFTTPDMPKLKHEKILRFEKLIEEHFTRIKKPNDYAGMLFISTNHLNKLCKEYTGKTAGELIRKRVLTEAQCLLYFTSNSVNEVADQLGFGNVSYFVTFFKKHTGETPEKFRKGKTSEKNLTP